MKQNVFFGLAIACVLVLLAIILSTMKRPESNNNIPASVGIIPSEPIPVTETPELPHFHYIEIINGCGISYDTTPCVSMRSGPSVSAEKVARLRTGLVLKVEDVTVQGEEHEWYKIIFDGEIRYPERVDGDWYVAVDPLSIRKFEDVGDIELTKNSPKTDKRIVVDISSETLYAYDGESLFMKELISTGLEFTPTPNGSFTVFRKTPSRYMQGPIEGVSDQYYDLPGVPWNLYFTTGGAVIHGAYWHNHFGEPWSHGCVNLSPENAQKLYNWADIRTSVHVKW